MWWIDGVEYKDSRLVTSLVDEMGNRSTGSLASLRSTLPPRGYEVAHESGVSLASLEPTDPAPYLEAVGIRHARRDGHQVFRLSAAGREVLLPAGVLLLALLGAPGSMGDHLLRPASLDQLVAPSADSGGHPVSFLLPHSVQAQLGTHMSGRMSWLTSYPSARRFWESVYLSGMRGTLGCVPPKASIDVRFFGRSKGNTVLASRVFVRSLVPQEGAFEFARGAVLSSFHFATERDSNSAAHLAAFRSATNTPELKRQVDIPEGELGWMMTDDEWTTVRRRLAAMGFHCRADALRGVNAALEKHGSGQTWTSLWIAKGSSSTYSDWLRSGRWDALKQILGDIRTP